MGDRFDLELDGVAIIGRYLVVDPPYRVVVRWDRRRVDASAVVSTTIEITLTPTAGSTLVRVQFSDVTEEEAAIYSRLWALSP